MGEAIGSTLGFAVGIAISPIPVAAVILMLFSGRARSNSVAFLASWVVGVAVVVTVFATMPGLGSDGGEPTTAAGWVKLALGVLLLLGGARQWRSRPRDEAAVEPPGWMTRIDDLGPAGALGLGFLLSALNPKNLLLAAAAGSTLATLELTGGEATAAIAVFTAIASLTVAIPVVGFMVSGGRLDDTLDAAKSWLIANNAAVMSVLFVVFGVNLLGDAIQILTSG